MGSRRRPVYPIDAEILARLPVRGIHRYELATLVVGQRKQARLARMEEIGPARRGSAAHQLRRIAVVPEADRVSKLMAITFRGTFGRFIGANRSPLIAAMRLP